MPNEPRNDRSVSELGWALRAPYRRSGSTPQASELVDTYSAYPNCNTLKANVHPQPDRARSHRRDLLAEGYCERVAV